MSLPLYDNFERIVLEGTPLIDVRAPVEFARGAFEGAVNLPLMNDKERELVGIRYKQNGNASAVALGHQLVSGKIKESRIRAWCDFIDAHPDAMLYCFRGGQRSEIAQQWLYEHGYTITRLKGGYKAFRAFLIAQLETMQGRLRPIRLGGYTGSGKTLLLNELEASIDLEALAKHRGSTFGAMLTPQPTQINFENALAFALIRTLHQGYTTLLFEDEGRHIGKCYLPPKFYQLLSNAPLVILETALEERIDITLEAYVIEAQQDYAAHYEGSGLGKWKASILSALQRIRKRLGIQRFEQIVQRFEDACAHQINTGDFSLHRIWIEQLLVEYYDPMYDYQLKQYKEKILFRGEKEALKEYLMQLTVTR